MVNLDLMQNHKPKFFFVSKNLDYLLDAYFFLKKSSAGLKSSLKDILIFEIKMSENLISVVQKTVLNQLISVIP